jgi:ABC-type Fe3+/spermidine/putrescine transport system ATPase subunit
MNPGFELYSVSRKYGEVHALADVSFCIELGESMAIIGQSGCGKSTMLRLLAGFDPPTAGRILLNGSVVSEPDRIVRPPHLRGVAMVFQDLALWPNLSVFDNILLGLAGGKLPKQQARRRAGEILSLCRIEHLAGRRPATISGGQQQRVALARALVGEPRFLLLDEPFSGLDLVTKATLLQDIARFRDEKEITLVVVSHDPLEATNLCHKAVVLNHGRIEEKGEMDTLLRNPKSEILRVFNDIRRIAFR